MAFISSEERGSPPKQGFLQANLFNFTVDLEYDHIRGGELRRLGDYHPLGNGLYRWTFLLKDMDRVQRVIGKIIEFNKTCLERDVLPHCQPLIRTLRADTSHYKKTTTYQIATVEEGYNVWWYRGSGEKESHIVCRPYIEHLWNHVIKKMDKDKPMPTAQYVEHTVKSLSLTNWTRHNGWDTKRWNNYIHDLFADRAEELAAKLVGTEFQYETSGRFNWKHFFGSRGEYGRIFYAPTKCFVAMGIVEHSKGGHITRLDKEFSPQAQFTELEFNIGSETPQKTRTRGTEKWEWKKASFEAQG